MKHQVLLRPLLEGEFGDQPDELRKATHDRKSYIEALKHFGLTPETATYNQIQALEEFDGVWKQIQMKMQKETPYARPEERMIEVDHIAPLDDATMIAGINPGRFETATTGVHAGTKEKRRRMKDFYESFNFVAAPNKFRQDRGVYISVRKFEKILTIKASNIISIDGKPVMDVGGADRGVKHLDLDEWTIRNISDMLED